MLTEADGGPLAVVIAGANVHDTKLLAATIEAVVVERPAVTPGTPQHLCLDKAYDNPTGHAAATSGGHTPHVRRIGEEQLDGKKRRRRPARRWVVERTISWLNRCRGVLVRHEKKGENYLGVVQLACALLWYRRLHRLKGF